MYSQEELLGMFGPSDQGAVSGLNSFSHIPSEKLEKLANIALEEDWGGNFWVLKKYLAVYIPKIIQQNRYIWFEDQLITPAGFLQTRFGIPLYLAFEINLATDTQQLYLKWVGDNPKCKELPEPPTLPEWPIINLSSEIVIAANHILNDRADRVPYLQNTPPVAQMCAITGAIQWSLHRHLHIRQFYKDIPVYLVPLYLQNREDITTTPDLVAPIQVMPNRLLVRTTLEPYMAYSSARMAVYRHDELPSWLLSTWREHSNLSGPDFIDD